MAVAMYEARWIDRALILQNGLGTAEKGLSQVYLECKETLHGLKHKDICPLTNQQVQQLMLKQAVPKTMLEQELLRRFLAAVSAQILLPKVIVEYTRTPYVYGLGNVRITFDRYIRSCSYFWFTDWQQSPPFTPKALMYL